LKFAAGGRCGGVPPTQRNMSSAEIRRSGAKAAKAAQLSAKPKTTILELQGNSWKFDLLPGLLQKLHPPQAQNLCYKLETLAHQSTLKYFLEVLATSRKLKLV